VQGRTIVRSFAKNLSTQHVHLSIELDARCVGVQFANLCKRLYRGEIPAARVLLNLAHLDYKGRTCAPHVLLTVPRKQQRLLRLHEHPKRGDAFR
jgi:hypothetical protein